MNYSEIVATLFAMGTGQNGIAALRKELAEATRIDPLAAAPLPLEARAMTCIAALQSECLKAGKAIEALTARVAAFEEALTPSAETKAAYSGEFSFSLNMGVDDDGADLAIRVTVPWTTTKEIMAANLARARAEALLKPATTTSAKEEG